jgi:hypothetical protein
MQLFTYEFNIYRENKELKQRFSVGRTCLVDQKW